MKIFTPNAKMTTAGTVFCRARPSSCAAQWIKQPQNLRLASARTFARRKPSPGLLRGPVLAHPLICEDRGRCLDATGARHNVPRRLLVGETRQPKGKGRIKAGRDRARHDVVGASWLIWNSGARRLTGKPLQVTLIGKLRHEGWVCQGKGLARLWGKSV